MPLFNYSKIWYDYSKGVRYMSEVYDYTEEFNCLKEFLLDIDCLNPLYEWTRKFNMFDILKITRTEIRHSNVLGWLLDPHETHGIGTGIIKGFVQHVVSSFSDDQDVFELLLMDLNDITIYREKRHIDILAVSDEEQFVLCIENKIDSKEHSNQLNRYRKIVEDAYPNHKKIFIFLSPDGMDASDMDYWCTMSYKDVIDIIEKEKSKVRLHQDAELLINNYIEAVRRDIVGDEKLIQLCAEIYNKHQKALDLIFENKPDKTSDLTAIFVEWAKKKTEEGLIMISIDNCSKKYTRFMTDNMSKLLPNRNKADSGWNTPNNYFYEIINDGGEKYYIQLAFSSKNLTDELRRVCEKINQYHPSRTQKTNWQWRIHFKTKVSKVPEEIDEEKIIKNLDEKLIELLNFEKKLLEELDV